MKLFGWDVEFLNIVRSSRRQEIAIKEAADPTAGGMDIDTLMARLHAAYDTVSGIHVTPETCMQAPTVQAIVQSVSKRLAILPFQVLQKSVKNNRPVKTPLPEHPTQVLLDTPNNFQTVVNWWMDKGSYLVRYGASYDYKARGNTGPIRRLIPLHPSCMDVDQDSDWNLIFKYASDKGYQELPATDVMYIRGPTRDGYSPCSPVTDVRETIALEIAAEKFGATFFGNGAMPFLIFKFIEGSKGFRTAEEQTKFIEDFQRAYAQGQRFKALALPAGMDVSDPVSPENNKAQFLETRKYQRTVIAGAWGVPPHMVGDLTSGTFNNVEQQSLDFVVNVVYPYVRIGEAQMETDLLTIADRKKGVIVRANLEAALRGDFASRQSGLNTQRRAGIINANEWRERENMNPIGEEDGGEDYWVESGVTIAGAEPPASASEPAPSNAPAKPRLVG
jgi:HK97 family phage portal protein